MTLKTIEIQTPLGSMIAIGDDQGLYLLEFLDKKNLAQEIVSLGSIIKSDLLLDNLLEDLLKNLGKTALPSSVLSTLVHELNAYFNKTLTSFTVPLHLVGTEFQKKSWQALCAIPYGTTKSYTEQAIAIYKPKACRAVANANSGNRIAIVVPCHRVIQSNGKLGGYSGGIAKKEWLLNHEQSFYKGI